MLFLPHQCHSFRTTVIPSEFLSFFPDFCHSFQNLSFLPNIVIPSELLPFQIFVIVNSSSTLPYPKGKKIGRQSGPYLRVHMMYVIAEAFMEAKACRFLQLFNINEGLVWLKSGDTVLILVNTDPSNVVDFFLSRKSTDKCDR